MDAVEFKAWRERHSLTQAETGKKFGVSRATVQNWENGVTPITPLVEQACAIWEDRLRQIRPDLGPVTLIYSDGPMFIDPYGPRRPLAIMRQEPYPTNAAALVRVRELWGRDDFHNPFIIDKAGRHLWNAVQLKRVVDGSDRDAPLWRRVTIARGSRQEGVADEAVKSMMNACARAYREKGVPQGVLVYRDRSAADDYIFYVSPSAYSLTGAIAEIADAVQFCDEPAPRPDLKQIRL